ncbi:MAG TPA: dethiobiotin synthase [Acidimicrobiales bacterium]|nr:dethiobiotin synthase [Acidimicrobiales bacterium]
MTRPERLVLVAGTATDIGKTWVGGQVLSLLHQAGTTVAARKPAQSADADDPGPSDAAVLAAATGEAVEAVCPPHRWYTVAMAPPMAADALGLAVPTLADLVAELTWPDGDPVQVGWVETVGGPRSPIGADGDAVDLAAAIDPDLVLLVADAGLGTVNSVRLGVDVFAPRRVVVFLNRYDAGDDLHRRNLDWLQTRERLEVVVDLEALSNLVAG